MKKCGVVSVAMAGLLFLFSCQPPVGAGDPTASAPAAAKLSEEIVNELVQKLASAPTASISRSISVQPRTLGQTDVDALKQAAAKRIADDGLADSTALDKLLPSMIAGVQAGIGSITSLSADNAAVIVNVANKSAIGSLTMAGRESNLGAGVTVDSAVGAIATTTVQAIIAVVPNADSAGAAIASVIADTASSLNSVTTINATQLSQSIGNFVASSARAVATNPNAADLVRDIADAAVASITVMNRLDAAAQSSTVSSAVTATIAAVVNAQTDSSQATQLVLDIVAAVSTVTSTSNLTIDLAAVVSAATTNTSVTINTTQVTAVASEALPTITSASADPAAVTFKNAVALLKVAATPASGYADLTYQWTQTSGTTVAIQQSTGAQAYFTVPATGTYAFKVAVRNKNGYKIVEKTGITVTATWVDTTFDAALTAGMTALKARQFDTAYQQFAQAAAIDSTNTDAVFWKTFLELMSISVDPSTVALFKERVGLVGYPATMEKLFSAQWFNGNYYGTKDVMVAVASPNAGSSYYIRGSFMPDAAGQTIYYYRVSSSTGNAFFPSSWLEYRSETGYFVPGETGSDYVDSGFYIKDTATTPATYPYKTLADYPSATRYARQWNQLDLSRPALLPQVDMPAWALPMLDADAGETNQQLKAYTIFPALLFNVISRNPQGLNDVVDQLLSGLFGARLDAVIAAVDALPDGVSVAIPNDLIAAYSYNNTLPTGFTRVSIGKAEMEAAVAQLKSLRMFLQLLASYDLNYPLSNFQFDWRSGSAVSNFFATAPKLLSTNVFGNRSDARRASAKASMLDYLSTLDKAAALSLQRDWKAYYKDVTGTDLSDADVAKVRQYVTNGRAIAATLKSAIDNNTSLFMDTSAISNGGIITTADYVWPTDATADTVYEVRPGALFATDILNPRKIMECSATGAVIYKSSVTGTGAVVTENLPGGGTITYTKWTINYDTPAVLGATQPADSEMYSLMLKINLNRVKEIFPSVGKTIPATAPVDGSGNPYVPVMSHYSYDYTNMVLVPTSWLLFDTWSLINWLR